jgi:TPR repeat protein
MTTPTTDLPDCPNFMMCPISHVRMEDPVVAGDHHSYDRKFIQAWFDKGNKTSPLTRDVISRRLAPNQSLKTQIKEWVDDQLRGKADMQKLDKLKVKIFSAATSEEAISLVTQISELVDASKFCLLPTSGVETLKELLDFKLLVTDGLTALLVVLTDQCQEAIEEKRTKHDKLNTKCLQLDTINTTMKEKQEGLQKNVADMANKVMAAEKIVVALEEQLVAEKQLVRKSKTKYDEAQTELDTYNESVTTMNKVHRELSDEKELIANELGNINSMHDEPESSSSSSGSSLSSSSVGSKRGRSSSSSSPASSSSASSSSSKRQKKVGTTMAEHAGQWLFEEGMVYLHGLSFKKEDCERGQLMIEASASSGFPMAVADCYYRGWNGMEEDEKKSFEMCVKIEQETNGYHWAQYMLGECCRYGQGTDQNSIKAVEWFTKSIEQGNRVAMNSLGTCHHNEQGCVHNMTKALELYEKSAQLGCMEAMHNLGNCYKNGWGVTKGDTQAREWYTKAVAQGHEAAQKSLDRLNGFDSSEEEEEEEEEEDDDSDFQQAYFQ